MSSLSRQSKNSTTSDRKQTQRKSAPSEKNASPQSSTRSRKIAGNSIRHDPSSDKQSTASSKEASSKATFPAHVDDQPAWAKLSDEKLLDFRICDLGLDFEQTAMTEYRDQLNRELKERNLKLRPHCWFSDDWFSPDDIPGIAVPFYMAHRRLMRLERNQMLEVEGGTKEWCMRIMRHEAGHAMDTAYRLHQRKGYKAIFGNYSDPYPETYRPRPRSKKFVLHLEPWYAQSHPAEDFAETFAVWLKPRSRWQKVYEGWAALKKIEYVDQLMGQVSGKPPKVKSRAKVDPVHRNTMTLREHYEQRHAMYSLNSPSVFDDDLKKIFDPNKPTGRVKTAAAFLQKNRTELSQTIAEWTGEYRYNINQVLREMIERCRLLKLYMPEDETGLKQNLLLMMTVHTMNYLHAGHRVAL